MNSQLYITSRMMFSLSRAGFAPERFGKLTARGVPAAALALSTVGIGLAVVVYALFPDRAFTLMMAISMFGAMFTWAMIFVTHLYFRRARGTEKLAFRMPGAPYTTVAGLVLMVAAMGTTAFTREFRMTLVYGVPFVLALAVLYRVRYRGVRERVAERTAA